VTQQSGRRASDVASPREMESTDLRTAREELASEERREAARQGKVLRFYLLTSVAFSLVFAAYFQSLDDTPYTVAALASIANALGMLIAFFLELRGRRTVAAVMSQTVPILPVLCYGAVFSVEAGFGSYLFIGALGTAVMVPEHRGRTRVVIVALLVVAIVVVQVFFSRSAAIAPLPPDTTAALATFNRTVMSVSLFALALLLNRSVRIRRRLVNDKLALYKTAANLDPLTGLPHRRPVWDVVQDSADRGDAFAIAMIDVDHFKELNDTHGHEVGDATLQRIAVSLREAVRGADVVGRWGGEEFVAVIPGTAQDAHAAMERVRRSIARGGGVRGSSEPRVTVSVGVAEHAAGADPWETLRHADRALYEAKALGRDRVVMTQPEHSA
jgi:diguanylate cyclase (GGDEF)-like protein